MNQIKKSCPFLKKYFKIDIEASPKTKDFLIKYQTLCPYLKKSQNPTMNIDADFYQQYKEEFQPQDYIKEGKCPMRYFLKNPSQLMANPSEPTQEQQYDSLYKQAIQELKREGRYRVFNYISRRAGEYPKARYFEKSEQESFEQMPAPENEKEVVVWCSNDYMGMGQHPKVKQAMIDCINKSGVGAGGTRNIGGSSIYHLQLEQDLSNWHEKEAALVMSSGFVANQAALGALAQVMPNCVFFSDEKNHSSIIEGIRHSKADKIIWKHNDLADLEAHLKKFDLKRNKIIVFESVYSMSGSISPINQICDLAKKYNAITFLDEVHAIGLYGHTGSGVAELYGCAHRVDYISGTMGKGIGCGGGYVVGPRDGIDCIRSFAPNFIFTTSIPPPIAAASSASIAVLRDTPEFRVKLHEVAKFIKSSLAQAGIPVFSNNSHIIPVFIGDAAKAKQASDILLKRYNIYIQPINYPTVPKGQEILRISPSPNHTYEMVSHLTQSLKYVFEELSIKNCILDQIQIEQAEEQQHEMKAQPV